ncbi:MAG: phosphatidate cytidylyltransferase [Elainellaceae cyanobacterium]
MNVEIWMSFAKAGGMLTHRTNLAGQLAIATLLTWAIALLWLALVNGAAVRGWLHPTLSRKLIHTGTGPLYVLCWLLFPDSDLSRYLAVTVPLGLTLVFLATGLGWIDNSDLVQSSTRHGKPAELLRGPLYYGIAFIVCTILFWRNSPAGILALMVMCGGDGLADIVGRRFGDRKLPFSPDKSWAGSAAMLLGSFAFGIAFLTIFNTLGYFEPSLNGGRAVGLVGAIALIATVVEALPFPDIDNITLTLAVVLLSLWWL